MKASIVIPAYNEEQGVGPVVTELRSVLDRHGVESEIIVVDDGSVDRTAQAAAAVGARVLRHRSNRGYGAALKSGISAATNDYVVITDADGTYPCQYIPEILDRLETADMVVGARIGSQRQNPTGAEAREMGAEPARQLHDERQDSGPQQRVTRLSP